MVHRATIQRDQSSAVNDWNVKDTPEYADHLTDQPCRQIWRTNAEVRMPQEDASVDNFILLLPLGTDVKTADVITQIADRQGAVKFSGLATIISLQPLNANLHLVCRAVKPDA
jgi:hypothetical protein